MSSIPQRRKAQNRSKIDPPTAPIAERPVRNTRSNTPVPPVASGKSLSASVTAAGRQTARPAGLAPIHEASVDDLPSDKPARSTQRAKRNLRGNAHTLPLKQDAAIFPPTPLPRFDKYVALFDPQEERFREAEALEMLDIGADEDEDDDESEDDRRETEDDMDENERYGFGQPRSPMPRSSPPRAIPDQTDAEARAKAKGKGRYQSPTPDAPPISDDDEDDDEDEDPEASASFIDASARTKLSLPTAPVNWSPPGALDNAPSSPIHASVQRKANKQAAVKRKRVDFDEGEEDERGDRRAVAGPSRKRKSSDILAIHKHKKPRRDPKPGALAAVARRLDGSQRTPARRTSTPGGSPTTPGDGKKRRNRSHKAKRPAYQLNHYTPRMKDVLGYGKNRYKLRVVVEDAFPNDALRTQFGRESFAQAREKKAEQFNASSDQTFDSAKLRVLADTSWGLRGTVKTLAMAQVVTGYNLERPRVLGVARTTSSVREAQAWTKERVQTLLHDSKFIEGPHNNLPAVRYMNPNVSTLIRAAIGCFGPEIQTIFTPMPHATVALAATCLEMALRQWSTGRAIPVPIGREDADVYRKHLDRLTDLKQGKPNRYKNLMHAISIDTFFYDNEVVDDPENAEEDPLKLYGTDSDDDEPAFD